MKHSNNDRQTDRLLRDVFASRPETNVERLRAGYVVPKPFDVEKGENWWTLAGSVLVEVKPIGGGQ